MIALMSRVELVCLSSIRTALIDTLQSEGLLHLDEVPLELEEAPGFLNRVSLEGEEQERYAALEELDRALAESVPLLSITPSVFDVQAEGKNLEPVEIIELREKVCTQADRLRDVVRQRVEIQDQLDVISNYRAILQEVAPALGSDVKLGRGTKAIVLTGNVTKAIESLEHRLQASLENKYTLHKTQTSRKHLVGLLVFDESREDEVSRILNQEGISPVDMRNDEFANATVSEVLQKIDSTTESNRARLGELEGELNKVSRETGASLTATQALTRDRLAQIRAQNQFAQSEMLTVIQGWTPDEDYGALENAVEKSFPGQVEVNRISHEKMYGGVPTLLKNHSFFKPFELVMSLFKPPAYGTVDPTWMVGLSFIIFYGFILGDAVYGAIIVGLALWIKSKWGKNEIGNAVGSIAMYMGISAIIFGVIYGEYLGNFGEKILGFPTPFHRALETTQLLVLAIMFGVILIPTALIMGVVEDLRHGHKKHAIEKAGMCSALLGLVLYVFGYFGVSFFDTSLMYTVDAVLGVAGVIMIFYAMGVMGLIGVIEVISLGGNVLSYGRLMALGVASIALAEIANTLPGMLGPWFGFPMALLVHVLNIGIGIASPTIHSLRLNFVEFLPKFYSPEGSGFNPFRKEAQW